MLKTWIYEGRLQDPFQEFFVRENTVQEGNARYRGTGASKASAWDSKYTLEESLVPGFIGQQVSKKVFLIGKSLNFIRGECGEEDYVIEQANEAAIEGSPSSLVF